MLPARRGHLRRHGAFTRYVVFRLYRWGTEATLAAPLILDGDLDGDVRFGVRAMKGEAECLDLAVLDAR